MQDIILNSPTISEQSNEFFQHLKNKLIGDDVYDKSPNAVGYRQQLVIFTGTGEASTAMKVYINRSFNQNITSDANGDFRFGIRLKVGKNNISVQYATTTDNASSTIYLRAYKLHTWLKAYAEEYLRHDNERKQQQQNIYLANYRVGNLTTTSQALRDNFGVPLKAERPSGFNKSQYREFLETMIDAWQVASTHEAFQLIANAFTGQDCEITEYPHTRQFPIGTVGKLRVKI